MIRLVSKCLPVAIQLIGIIMILSTMTACKDQSTETGSSKTVSTPAPRLVPETTHLDLGKGFAGDMMSGQVTVRNTGTADLIISRAMGVGSGIAVDYPREPIKPGMSADLKVTLNTKGRSGVEDRRIVIMSNDPDTPRQSIILTADVELLLGVHPRRVWFGGMHGSEPIRREFEIRGSDIAKIVPERLIIKAEGFEQHVHFSIRDTRPETNTITIIADVLPGHFKPGNISVPLRIETGLPDREPLEAFLTGTITGPYVITPSRLYFGRYTPGDVYHQNVTVQREDNQPFRILSIETDTELFSVEPYSGPAAYTHTLTVRFSADESAGPRHRSAIILQTDSSDYPFADVPLFAFMKTEKKR